METEGASILWKRSVSRLNLRYVNVVSDGDSKAIVQLHKIMPYGSNVSIVKYECVGHVQKRVGAFIINLRENPPIEMVEVIVKKGRKARKATKNRPAVEATPDITKMVAKKVRIGGKGGISGKKYKTLQQYYGNAIRENARDLEG